MFECKSNPDVVFHFRRVSGWPPGLTVMRSIKSAWHDSWFFFFPMSSKPNLFKLFWGGVSSTEYEIMPIFAFYLNVSDFCLFVAHRTCVVWNCQIVCACVSPTVVSLLSCYLSAPREAGLEACERGCEWLCRPQSPDNVSAVCHTYTGTHCSRVLMRTSWLTPFLSWFNICPDAYTYTEVVRKLSEIVKVQRNRKCQRNHRCFWHPAQRTSCVKL